MSTKNNHGGNMLITTSNWGPYKTFKLMPLTKECPYVEAIYDPSSKILAIISKTVKNAYHMVPKLDDNGDSVTLKIGKRASGKDIKEQRVLMDTHAEYYLTDLAEMKSFIEIFAVNTEYDYNALIDSDVQPMKKPLSSEKQPI